MRYLTLLAVWCQKLSREPGFLSQPGIISGDHMGKPRLLSHPTERDTSSLPYWGGVKGGLVESQNFHHYSAIRGREKNYIMIKDIIHQEDLAILNVWRAPNNRTIKCAKQKLNWKEKQTNHNYRWRLQHFSLHNW